MNGNQGQAALGSAVGYGVSVAEAEAERAIPRAMTDLASGLGDLETAARGLLNRIGRLIPGGSPFERIEKSPPPPAGNVNQIQPARSHHHDELQSRIYQLREITSRINEAARGIEV